VVQRPPPSQFTRGRNGAWRTHHLLDVERLLRVEVLRTLWGRRVNVQPQTVARGAELSAHSSYQDTITTRAAFAATGLYHVPVRGQEQGIARWLRMAGQGVCSAAQAGTKLTGGGGTGVGE
jgi:hypothetical protein